MKKLILTCAVILSYIAFLSASNVSKHATMTILPNEMSFVLNLEAFDGGIKYVTISDKRGKNILSDEIESNKQRIKYVLDYLPTDIYTVTVKGDELIEYYSINVSENSIDLNEVKSYSSPTVKSQDNKIIVNSYNDSQEEIRLSFYNNENDLVYTFSESSEGIFHKIFNLDHLATGDYSIFVSNKHFTEEITISQ